MKQVPEKKGNAQHITDNLMNKMTEKKGNEDSQRKNKRRTIQKIKKMKKVTEKEGNE